jgi:thymidylate kinase
LLPNILSTSLNPITSLEEQQALDLVIKLCQTLEAEQINYCHWKSNEALARSASGDNDLDLLISREDAERFTEILFRLGFRETQENSGKRLPGVLNYFGYDVEADRIVHIHLHYQLVLGNDLSKNYRIPIERPYLDSATQVGLFRVPAPEFELVIFVLRMVLKHSTWDSILMGHAALSPSEGRELKYLATAENLEKAKKVLERFLPYIDHSLFEACVQAIEKGCPLIKRIRTGEKIQRALEACARFPQTVDIVSKFSRRLSLSAQSHLFHRKSKRRLANGGLLIAIVGGDGSGKSTAIDGLDHWLPRVFEVMKLHLGKPAWSWITIAVRGLLKIGTAFGLYSFNEDVNNDGTKFPGYPSLIRTVCNGRDRYLAYLKARRFASNGGLVICDRYPLPNLLAMDTPQCRRIAKDFNRTGKFLEWLTALEDGYYRKIAMPDLLIVLKVDPETAVQRKVDESEASVRRRSSLVWALDWSKTPAYVLDASLPQDQVLTQIKTLIWSHL